jgi:ubiquinone/menaquinone biosynthesis C-methylase UbiE
MCRHERRRQGGGGVKEQGRLTRWGGIRGARAVRDAYRDDKVARGYIDQRFIEPLGALLHARQATALKRLFEGRRPGRVLEIAPGPARLTVEVAGIETCLGTVMDASAQMLAEAQRRLAPIAGGRWTFVQGDVFQLPFDAEFDIVFAFRLLRHFDDGDRARIYGQIARVLKPGGLLVFDAVNELVSARLREENPAEYQHYDALLRPERLAQELGAAGFQIAAFEGVQRRFRLLSRLQTLVAPRSRPAARLAMELVDRFAGGEPLEWIVTCQHA